MKEILLKLRTENRYSQNLLAKELGISRQAYMKYESGEVEPSVEIVRRLSKLFNVSYSYLIDNGIENIPKNTFSCTPKKSKEMYVANTSPVYSATKTYNFEQTNKLLESLSFEQQQIVFSLINSLAKINNKSEARIKRTPGGLNGKFIMSEDFDEPLDDFKEYM